MVEGTVAENEDEQSSQGSITETSGISQSDRVGARHKKKMRSVASFQIAVIRFNNANRTKLSNYSLMMDQAPNIIEYGTSGGCFYNDQISNNIFTVLPKWFPYK